MRSFQFLSLAIVLAPCLALLEERFIAFEPKNGSVDITNVQILYSWDDFVGVRIAAESLANDYAEITGRKPEARNISRVELNQPRNGTASSTAIIVGSLKSSLIKHLAGNGTRASLDVGELEGKWETFKTALVSSPLPGVQSALVITGSDKRGAIYGIHTLAEQCGQSPYVSLGPKFAAHLLIHPVTIGLPTSLRRSTKGYMLCRRQLYMANRV
jgi:hypothetical protein